MGLPALDQELDRLKAKLADLSSHYTDLHPDVRKVKEQIARTEKMKEQVSRISRTRMRPPPADNPANRPQSNAEIKEMSPMSELESQLKVNRIEIANREHNLE